jgi:hypothetical protein
VPVDHIPFVRLLRKLQGVRLGAAEADIEDAVAKVRKVLIATAGAVFLLEVFERHAEALTVVQEQHLAPQVVGLVGARRPGEDVAAGGVRPQCEDGLGGLGVGRLMRWLSSSTRAIGLNLK